jgi:hypothetical protein
MIVSLYFFLCLQIIIVRVKEFRSLRSITCHLYCSAFTISEAHGGKVRNSKKLSSIKQVSSTRQKHLLKTVNVLTQLITISADVECLYARRRNRSEWR